MKTSLYLVTLHKGASSFIRTVLAPMLAEDLDFKHVPVAEELLKRDRPAPRALSFDYDDQSHVYSRLYPAQAHHIDLADKKWIAIQRDPRDMAVSWYYSVRYSHPTFQGPRGERLLEDRQKLSNETRSEGIRSMAARSIAEFASLWKLYEKFDGGLMTSYEDMVTSFPTWFDRVLSHIDADIDAKKYHALQSEFVVEDEDPRRHKRRITPGNWRSVFDDALREQFAERIGRLMADAGYEP